ncbi:class II glutamine amidotransferase [Actinocatenispora comari]|uniref:Glutamine amidotransferase type-2 domain-containing protein n=1 Tax=Actinocatenispora comari TaxID=2807577 RepID=A0A8J4AG89_9ACTN|nr:class II glutamine amidotransferase [Actinocatenispora comari]GIL29112.1 hypothetical protein NUM_43660 [Actinocatenispora comari]
MCLITFLPEGIEPDAEALVAGADCNPDGHGYAIVDGDRLLVERGLDAHELVEGFLTARRAHPAGAALFHSRLATHGVINTANCHPFRLGADRRTVMAHNGILPHDVRPKKGERRSDSRIAAERYLPRLGSLQMLSVRHEIERWMGTGNKMVLLTADPAFDSTAYLLNEQSGFWVDGAWYSNLNFVDASGPWRPERERDVWACLRCDGPVGETGLCLQCGYCQFCGGYAPSCECWDHLDTWSA